MWMVRSLIWEFWLLLSDLGSRKSVRNKKIGGTSGPGCLTVSEGDHEVEGNYWRECVGKEDGREHLSLYRIPTWGRVRKNKIQK